mgnify:CR=1 FL=1
MRLGVFGGSFDPVHYGHLLLAESCQQQARLDRVLLMPAAQQPLKPHAPLASAADRVAMLRLAIADRPALAVSTVEIDRGGVSYTADTLRALQKQHPHAELFFLLGADALADLPTWREPEAILALATPIAVRRPGSGEPDVEALAPLTSSERLAAMRSLAVDMPPTPIASSQIRQQIAEGGPWQALTPPAGADYIVAHGLYGADARPTTPPC